MLKKGKPWPDFLVGMILAAVMIAIFATASRFGVSEPWGDATAYTFMAFVMVTGMLRSVWHHAVFWGWLAAIIVAHVIGLIVFEQGFPEFARRFRGIPLGLSFLVEAVVIAALLAKKFRPPKEGTAIRRTSNSGDV
jgi:hypothetical protein